MDEEFSIMILLALGPLLFCVWLLRKVGIRSKRFLLPAAYLTVVLVSGASLLIPISWNCGGSGFFISICIPLGLVIGVAASWPGLILGIQLSRSTSLVDHFGVFLAFIFVVSLVSYYLIGWGMDVIFRKSAPPSNVSDDLGRLKQWLKQRKVSRWTILQGIEGFGMRAIKIGLVVLATIVGFILVFDYLPIILHWLGL